ncbi:MAG: polysaccharide deacetylase family protein [Spongiibacteraceae bacterium]
MRKRQFVVGCLSTLFYLGLYTGFYLFAPAAAAEQWHAVVLQYRHVGDAAPAATSISVNGLQRQLRYLRDNRYTVLPLPELVQRLRSGQSLPERSVAISFDGANRSVCETAFPLLNELKIPFTIFVNVDAIDKNSPANCTWDQLRALAAAGVTLANHTVNHSHLIYRGDQPTGNWRAQILAEIEDGEQRILERPGQSHRLLAWPHGEFNEATKQLARDAGYVAFGQQSGPLGRDSDWLELPRFPMSGEAGLITNLPAFGAKLQTLPFPIEAVHAPDIPLTIEGGIPSLELVLRANRGGRRPLRTQLQCFSADGKRISSHWLSETRFRVKAYRALPLGHASYNCTLPAGSGRFYWYSHAWITADTNGRWPDR